MASIILVLKSADHSLNFVLLSGNKLPKLKPIFETSELKRFYYHMCEHIHKHTTRQTILSML